MSRPPPRAGIYMCALTAHEHSLTLATMPSTASQPVPMGCVAPRVGPQQARQACEPADTRVGQPLSSSATGALPMTARRPSQAPNRAARSRPKGRPPCCRPHGRAWPSKARGRARHSKARATHACCCHAPADGHQQHVCAPCPGPCALNGAPARSRRLWSNPTPRLLQAHPGQDRKPDMHAAPARHAAAAEPRAPAPPPGRLLRGPCGAPQGKAPMTGFPLRSYPTLQKRMPRRRPRHRVRTSVRRNSQLRSQPAGTPLVCSGRPRP